jgi:hypothetical protein
MIRTNVRWLVLASCLIVVSGINAREVDARKIVNDLKTIGLAYHNHLDAAGKPPAKAEDLAPYFENDKRLLALLKDKDIVFIYGVGIKEMTDGTSNTILAYEKDAPTKGGACLYGDGSVKKLDAEEFKKATKAKSK